MQSIKNPLFDSQNDPPKYARCTFYCGSPGTLNRNDRNKIASQKIEINKLNQEISKLDKEKSKLLAEYKQADDDKGLQATLEKYRVEHELYKLMLDTKEFVE